MTSEEHKDWQLIPMIAEESRFAPILVTRETPVLSVLAPWGEFHLTVGEIEVLKEFAAELLRRKEAEQR